MGRVGVFDCMCKLVNQDRSEKTFVLELIKYFLASGTLMSRKEATNNKYLIKLKQKDVVNGIKKLKKSQDSEVSKEAFGILKGYLKEPILKKKLRLKRAIICFKNERHALFGIFQNKKKKLSV